MIDLNKIVLILRVINNTNNCTILDLIDHFIHDCDVIDTKELLTTINILINKGIINSSNNINSILTIAVPTIITIIDKPINYKKIYSSYKSLFNKQYK